MVRILNRTQTAHVGDAAGVSFEAIEVVRGVDMRVHGRGLVLETHSPRALVVNTSDRQRRIAIPSAASPVIPILAPVAAFLVARAMMKRRDTS